MVRRFLGRDRPDFFKGADLERSRGLKAASSPVGVAPGPDGNMWFTDEGATAALGRVTPSLRIREFTTGLQPGAEPALISPAPDGQLWFTDEGSNAAVGRLRTGAPAALKAAPAVRGTARAGGRLSCRAAVWASWARLTPSIDTFAFDGYRWLRDGTRIPGRRSDVYAPTAADRGHRLSCTETVTYPAPFEVTAQATSTAVHAR